MRSLNDAESATSARWSNWSAMPSTWEPENGRNLATAISLYTYALHSSQTTNFPRPAGFRSCFVADERGRTIVLSPLLFLCPPPRPLPLYLPRTALSSHPIRHPSLLPLFSVLSPHLRVSHITPGIDRAEISGARSVLRSSLGGRENPSCLFSRHYSGDALISIFLS